MTLNKLIRIVCGLHNPFTCHLDLGGGGSAPPPDPQIGAAALANSAVAKDALAFYKQVYADQQPRQAAMDALSQKVVNDQLSISAKNQQRADEQWNQYISTFAPVEQRTAQDAMNIDSAAELARVSGEAATGVQAQFDNAAGQRRRAAAAMGINPNSGRALAMEQDAQLGLAATKAGAANNARTMARDRGISLRAGVANFGRNMPNTAANAYGIAMSGGNSAVGNSAAAMTSANANAGTMGTGYNAAISGNNSAGQILNNQYATQVNAWGAQQQADAASSAGLGNMVGTLGAAWIGSSKKIKKGKKPVSDEETLKKVKDVPVESWQYKDGEGDGGRHVGPYAEDMQSKFGDGVAPEGKAIDMISMNGITLSAVKGLAKQVDKLDKKVSKLAAGGIGRA